MKLMCRLFDHKPHHYSGVCLRCGEHDTYDTGIMNCTEVKCECPKCPGVLQSAGRNVGDNLTFLECNSCGCCYVANDKVYDEADVFRRPPAHPLSNAEKARILDHLNNPGPDDD